MNVEYVNPVNLTLLEDAYNSGIKNTKDITKDFGKNLSFLLSHIKISFVISEISIFEAYMLKIFSGGNFVDLETYMDDNKIDSKKYPVTHRTMQSLFLLNKTIINDNDVSVKPGALLFPSKCIEKKCIVSFQGQNILSIIGALVRGPECFFVKLENAIIKSPERTKNDIIKDLLIEFFIKEFYTFVSYKIQYMDILTDSTLYFNYLSHAEKSNDLVMLSHINTIYGDIPFVNINNDIYSSSLTNINNNKSELKLMNNSVILDSTEIFFLCNTSFYTFMEAFMYLPIGSVVESTDIKTVYSSDRFIIPDEMSKYQSRVTSIIEKMKEERERVSKDKNIDNFNLIPLNTRIQYSVKFKLSEISNILGNWENKINDDNIYGDINNYISKEILSIISNMKKYAISAYLTISK